MNDPLEALLQEALSQSAKRKVKGLPEKPDRLDRIRESFKSVYATPENWNRTCGVALIHRSDDGQKTLLGNFTEFVHKKNRAARKLVREAQPLAIGKEEFVTGEWWLRAETLARIKDSNHHEVRTAAIERLELSDLQVYAEHVLVRVHLHQSWIARVELAEQTQFVSPLNDQILYLPIEVDILDSMTIEAKMKLREELGV